MYTYQSNYAYMHIIYVYTGRGAAVLAGCGGWWCGIFVHAYTHTFKCMMLGGAMMGGEWGSTRALVFTIYDWIDQFYEQIVLSTPLKTGNPQGACDSVL